MKRFATIVIAPFLALAALFIPVLAYAASWAATDNFESYSTGNINGDNGGTGWSGAWAVAAGGTTGCVVVSTPVNSGTRSLQMDGTVTCDVSRTVTTGATTGTMQLYLYVANQPGATNGYTIVLKQGSTNEFAIDWGSSRSSGNNIVFDNLTTGVTLLATPAATTWYQIQVQFDQANSRARASLNGGAFSAYVTAAGGTYTSIDTIRATTQDGVVNKFYVDDIGTPPVGSPATADLIVINGVQMVVTGVQAVFF